jgi:osmotically-inducible protein OsmY
MKVTKISTEPIRSGPNSPIGNCFLSRQKHSSSGQTASDVPQEISIRDSRILTRVNSGQDIPNTLRFQRQIRREEMNDKQLRQEIIDELDFEPRIDAADIGVAVEDGVATLTGHVRVYNEKVTAIRIVEGIKGVKAIADEIEVRPVGSHITADDEIAKRILSTFKWNSSVPEDKIKALVKNGWVTLSGEVDWKFKSMAAENAVRRLTGVIGVNNQVKVKPSVKATEVKNRIKKALHRDAELDASGIQVEVVEGTVKLEGKVRYLGERRSAERAAWAVPGVTNVIDNLAIQ